MDIILKEGERVEILATTKGWTRMRWVSPEGNEIVGWARVYARVLAEGHIQIGD